MNQYHQAYDDVLSWLFNIREASGRVRRVCRPLSIPYSKGQTKAQVMSDRLIAATAFQTDKTSTETTANGNLACSK